jgi:acetyltransferase-like isoleucine patch superfamily enzyme
MKFNARNVYISRKASLGANVRIGDDSAIYDNVEIGDDSVICNNTVLGEPLMEYYSNPEYQNPPTVIGAGAMIRSHSIIYAACNIGPGLTTGHRVTIRENSTIGEQCAIGTSCDLQGDVKLGRNCRLHSHVHISKFWTLGDCVFLFPYSTMTNDPYPPSEDIAGGTIGSYTVLGVHVVVLPKIRIGENCVIGASSLVTRHVPNYSLATGNPAKIQMDVRKYAVLGKGRPYPWMNRFERGMPWSGIGFEKWIAQNSNATWACGTKVDD